MSQKYDFASDLTERQRKTFAERLLRLRGLLQSLSPKQYIHEEWVRTLGPEASKGKTCGTVACAMGHAAANPVMFPTLNLKVRLSDYSWADPGDFVIVTKDGRDDVHESVWAGDYFGEYAYNDIFLGEVFDGYDDFDATVTRGMVTRQLAKLARERYGYEPA